MHIYHDYESLPNENAWVFTYLPRPPMYSPFAQKSFCYDHRRSWVKRFTRKSADTQTHRKTAPILGPRPLTREVVNHDFYLMFVGYVMTCNDWNINISHTYFAFIRIRGNLRSPWSCFLLSLCTFSTTQRLGNAKLLSIGRLRSVSWLIEVEGGITWIILRPSVHPSTLLVSPVLRIKMHGPSFNLFRGEGCPTQKLEPFVGHCKQTKTASRKAHTAEKRRSSLSACMETKWLNSYNF